MDENALVVAEHAQFVRLDFVFFNFVVSHVALSGIVTPGAFHDPLFANKIGGLNRIGFIGGAENHPVAEIQGQDF